MLNLDYSSYSSSIAWTPVQLALTLFGWFWNGSFQNVPYVFCIFKMYNTGWAKSRRALDCFFIFMAEILGGYWQILDRSGKKIILLSPLIKSHCYIAEVVCQSSLLPHNFKSQQNIGKTSYPSPSQGCHFSWFTAKSSRFFSLLLVKVSI